MDKLEGRYIFKGNFLKYNNLKSKTHLYNTYKNKLHHTIGVGIIRKKKIKIGKSFSCLPSKFLIRFYNNIN